MEQAEKACPFRFKHAGMETMWANMVSYGKLANISPAALLPRAVSGLLEVFPSTRIPTVSKLLPGHLHVVSKTQKKPLVLNQPNNNE